jgi:hypothetical protein
MQRPHGRERRDALDHEGAGLEERNSQAISKGEPRRLVVCGTTVMSARSRSPKATLTTSAGRCGVGIFLVEGLEQNSPSSADLFVHQGAGIEGQHAAENLVRQDGLLLGRKVLEGLQQGLTLVAHVPILADAFRAEPAYRRLLVCTTTAPSPDNSHSPQSRWTPPAQTGLTPPASW